MSNSIAVAHLTRLLESARPLVFGTDNPELAIDYPYGIGGTGFVVSYENALYLITAGHCVSGNFECKPEHIFMTRHKSRLILPLLGKIGPIPSGILSEYDLDICICPADMSKVSAAQAKQFRPLYITENCLSDEKKLHSSTLCLRGYPKNKASIDEALRFTFMDVCGKYNGKYGNSLRAIEYMDGYGPATVTDDVNGISGAPVIQAIKETVMGIDWRFAGVIVRSNLRYAYYVDARDIFDLLIRTRDHFISKKSLKDA